MERLNLTLDAVTSGALSKHAKLSGLARATLARELICVAIARRETLDSQRKLARDYAAGSEDAGELADLEVAQLELLDRDEG